MTSTYKILRSYLQTAGVEVYLPGHYPGDPAESGVCKKPYIVLQNGGTYAQSESNLAGYTVIYAQIYVPLNQYEYLQELADDVLATKIFVSADGEPTAGTMPNNGAVAGTFDGLENLSYTIPAGYHNGGGTVALTNDIEVALAAI